MAEISARPRCGPPRTQWMRWLLLVAVTVVVAFAPARADACCSATDEPSPRSAARHADEVFLARVVALDDFGLVEFEVEEVWKGEPEDPVVLLAEENCVGWSLPAEGEEVIVYLNSSGPEDGRINWTAHGEDMEEHERFLDRRYPGCAVSSETGTRGLGMLLLLVALRRRRRAC